MSEPIITIPLDELDRIVDDGKRWTTGVYSASGKHCLHGAIRLCSLQPGDAHLIEQVGARHGFGTRDNDRAGSWAEIRQRVIPEITDDMLAETFGPQWEQIVALVRRAATLTVDEARALAADRAARDAARNAARDAAWGAAWNAARDAAWGAARDAAWEAAWGAARDAAWEAAWGATVDAAWEAARALVARDLIGEDGFTQAHYDLLTGPWRKVIGPVHPDDEAVA